MCCDAKRKYKEFIFLFEKSKKKGEQQNKAHKAEREREVE